MLNMYDEEAHTKRIMFVKGINFHIFLQLFLSPPSSDLPLCAKQGLGEAVKILAQEATIKWSGQFTQNMQDEGVRG